MENGVSWGGPSGDGGRRLSGMFRFGRSMHERRWLVAAAWVLALAVLGPLAGSVGSDFRSDFDLDSEATRGFEVLEDEFGGLGSGLEGSIVFRASQGVEDPVVQEAMSEYFDALEGLDEGLTLISPYEPEGVGQVSTQGEHAGKIAFARMELARDGVLGDAEALGEQMLRMAPEVEGLEVEVGGGAFVSHQAPQSEVLGMAAAIVILILAFGSVLAMGLPIGTAVAGIGIGSTLTVLLSNLMAMPEFAPTLAVMIGLGVGIDYALFIVTRYREELHRGHSHANAAGIALDTAGRAVLFAGTTVVISLGGMLLIGVPFVTGLGVSAALVVGVTMIASVTLLPALLGFAAHRVEVTRWRGLLAASLVAVALAGIGAGIDALVVALPLGGVVLVAGFFVPVLRRQVPRRPPRPLKEQVAWRWSRFVQHHPVAMVIVGLGMLGTLTVPVFGLRLGFSDEGNLPPESTTRRAYDLLSVGFGPGFNGPLLIVARLPDGSGPETADRLESATGALASDGSVQEVFGPLPNDLESPTAVLWRVIPTTSPQASETEHLVDRLREEVLPDQFGDTGLEPLVTGFTAVSLDFSDYLANRMLVFFAVVLSLSFLLLMAVFRSLLVPLKAVVMNLLSISAAYGITVALFQWGWAGEALGVQPAPIEPFVPMMLFAIVFGLSMDYEVFLLSRVKEEYDRHGDNAVAVADGLAATARLITAAALIMVFVFGAFLLEDERVVKLFGFALATAIALDASVVRMLLVPATMELLGDRNWWLPRWLERSLPRLDVEGGHDLLLEVGEEHGQEHGEGLGVEAGDREEPATAFSP